VIRIELIEVEGAQLSGGIVHVFVKDVIFPLFLIEWVGKMEVVVVAWAIKLLERRC
jgi:hypothetical protein